MLLSQPALERLDRCECVLLAGAGGGFDIFAGLPLFFALRARGKTVHLANLSFSQLERPGIAWPHESVAEVRSESPTAPYFPEQVLCTWLAKEGMEQPIYAFRREGVVPIRAGYEWLVEQLAPDAVVLVDGGSDSLMRGDEFGLGTPEEDAVSIAAAWDLDVAERLLLSVGFGVDLFHGVCHAQVLRAMAELTKEGGYLGAMALLPEMPEVQKYLAAVAYAQEHTSRQSIVSASIVDAISGNFGNHHSTTRTGGSKLFINPLMSLCWFFDLPAVAERLLYLDRISDTRTWRDVSAAISMFRGGLEHGRDWEDIPL